MTSSHAADDILFISNAYFYKKPDEVSRYIVFQYTFFERALEAWKASELGQLPPHLAPLETPWTFNLHNKGELCLQMSQMSLGYRLRPGLFL